MMSKLPKRFSSVRMQLVASVFLWILPAFALTYVVNQNWFWEYAPGWLREYTLTVPRDEENEGLLLLGDPGTGKSQIMHQLIDEIASRKSQSETAD